MRKLVILTVAIIVVAATRVQLANATIIVISKSSNETVFSAEEIGIDAASAYDLKGTLIVADPIDACSDVKPPPTRNHTIVIASITGQHLQRRDSWILWATFNYTGDPCSLSRKAKEAEYAGYSAIVITVYGTNDTAGILPSFMGFDWMGVRIYTSILGENMGNALKKYAYPNATNYYLQFENEPYFQLGLLANFIFLGCLGTVIVVILLRCFHCLYMRVSSSVQERRRKRKAYLTEAQLKKLPVLHWRTSIPQDTCSICIENFEPGEEIRVLPCSHVFHKPCIDPWLIHSSRRCPNCKGKVIFPNEHLSDSSNSDSDSHIEDSDDDFIGDGNERTPLLRGHASDSDDPMLDTTRFIETAVAHSQSVNSNNNNSSSHLPTSSSSSQPNSLFMGRSRSDPNRTKTESTACLIDISSSDSEQISDDSFGSFQSADGSGSGSAPSAGRKRSGGGETMLVDVDCNLSLKSAKSFDSDKTFVEEPQQQATTIATTTAVRKQSISKKNPEEVKSPFGSSTSFFSCLESELEKSTTSSSSNNNELFQSFSS